MKKRIFLGLILAMTMLVGSSLSVFATDVTVEGTQSTGTCTTTLTVTEEMLGGSLVVSIPATMTYTGTLLEGNYTFLSENFIGAQGALAANKKLCISAPETYVMTNTTEASYTFDALIFLNDRTTDGTTPIEGTTITYPRSKNKITVGESTLDVFTLSFSPAEVLNCGKYLADNSKPNFTKCVGVSYLGETPPLGTYTGTVNFYISVLDNSATPSEETIVFS